MTDPLDDTLTYNASGLVSRDHCFGAYDVKKNSQFH
jgi:hypothetical protein